METIIQRTGLLLFRLNLKGRRLFCTKILRSHTSVIVFVMLVCSSVLLVMFLGLGYSLAKVIVYTIAVQVTLFVVLLFIGSWHEAKRLQQNELISYFHFNRSNLYGIELSNLGFSDPDRENLNLVLSNLSPSRKIDFKLVSDNQVAADYKKLFRILHLLIAGGINDLKKEPKKKLFMFIESTFTLNGSEVNMASLNSRFSEWVNESETEFLENLNAFQKILGN